MMLRFGFAFLFQVCSAVALPTIEYPENAGIINVANPPAGFAAALPDDGVDDTAAINALLSAYNGQAGGAIHVLASRVIYFPAGVYQLSDTLVARIDGQTASSVTFAGAGDGETIFRLQDGASGFDGTRPKPLIQLGKQYSPIGPRETGPDAAFGNLVRNLRIELGDNPGAIGVSVALANMGQIHDVSITAQEAFAGLVTYDRAGPGLIRNVTIEHCDYGIYQLWDHDDEYYMQFPGYSQTDGITMEHLTIFDYKISGIYNQAKHYILHDVLLSSPFASGPAVHLGFKKHPAQFEALDLRIVGNPACPGIEVAHDDVFLYLRDARIEDCAVAVDLLSGSDVMDTVIDEFSTHSMISRCRPGARVTLDLPIKETPVFIPGSTDWTCTTMSPANSGEDNAQALQNDITQCTTPVLYIPYGLYELAGDIVVSNPCLKMIKGFFPYLVGAPQTHIQHSDGVLIFEDLVISPNHQIVQESDNPLAFRNIGVGPKISNIPTAKGDIFLENMGAQPQVSVCGGINVYMRQLNREKQGVINDGAVIWCLGDCIESMGGGVESNTAPWVTVNGGVTEIIGAQLDAETHAAVEEEADYYVYEIDGTNSQFSMMGSGLFATNLNLGWDLLIKDECFADYLIRADEPDYDIRTYSGSVYGRMVVAPFIIDRRNLAFYPMEDLNGGSQSSWGHLSSVEPSLLTQESQFGFVDSVFDDDINGMSKNINTMYLDNSSLELISLSSDYCEFSVTPSSNHVLNISGVSLQLAAKNNDYGQPFSIRVYLTTGGAAPVVLGSITKTIEDGECSAWETLHVDLSEDSSFQNLTESRSFRLYMRANVNHWRCIGLFDNVTVHGTCEKPLVKFDFESGLEPSFQDEAAQGLTAFDGRLCHVNNLGLANENGTARVLGCQTLSSLHDSVEACRYLEFTLKATNPDHPLDLKTLEFDWSAVQLGPYGPLACTMDVQASVKGFGEYQSIARFEHTFADTTTVVPVKVNLDFPAFRNLADDVSIRLYVSDNQFSYLYRPSIDNLRVCGWSGL